MKRSSLLTVVVALCATAAGIAPAAHAEAGDTSADVMVVPASIDPTGQRDVSADLNAFFASVPDDTVVRLRREARYRIESTVQLVDKRRVLLGGNRALMFATTQGYRERAHLSVVGGSDVTIRNLRIRGAHSAGGLGDEAYVADLEAQHGIQLHGPERVRISNVTISDVYGDFVYVGRDLRRKLSSYAYSSRDVTIEDSTFTRNGRQGIAVTQGSRVLITGNNISEVRRTTFDLEPNGPSWLVEDVSIENNQVGTGRLNFLSASGRGPVNDIRVAGNVLDQKVMNVMIVDRNGESRRNWSFIGNESGRPFGSPLIGSVVGYGLHGVEFRNNVLPMQPRRNMVGIRLERSCGATVGGNILENAVAESTGGESACPDGAKASVPQLPAQAQTPSGMVTEPLAPVEDTTPSAAASYDVRIVQVRDANGRRLSRGGRTMYVRARVVDRTGDQVVGVPGVRVRVCARDLTADSTRCGSRTTSDRAGGGKGWARWGFRPSHTSTVRVVLPTTGSHGRAASGTTKVRVVQRVALRPRSAKRRETTLRVFPAARSRLVVHKRSRDGWRRLGAVRTSAAGVAEWPRDLSAGRHYDRRYRVTAPAKPGRAAGHGLFRRP